MKTGSYDIKEVHRLLLASKYFHDIKSFFSPYDIMPYNKSFAYSCKRLALFGFLESDGEAGRWGYFYRFTEKGIIAAALSGEPKEKSAAAAPTEGEGT